MDPRELRHFRHAVSKRAVIVATIAASIAAAGSSYLYRRYRLQPMRDFYQNYDKKAEWEALLKSGVLKTVDKDGKNVDLFD